MGQNEDHIKGEDAGPSRTRNAGNTFDEPGGPGGRCRLLGGERS